MQEQEIITEEEIDLTEKIIMPTQREFTKSKKFNLPIMPLSKFAVFVKKMAAPQRHNWINNLEIDRSTIQNICIDESSYNFLLNFQFKRCTSFNKDELDYLEKVQQIPELLYLSMNEKDKNQTAEEFSNQLEGWKSRNNRKIIVPAIEPDTNDLTKKIAIMKKKNIRRCAVIFRSYFNEEDRATLSKVLANLRVAGIYSFVLGINPTKWKNTGASMLLPPLQFEANAVSSWIAWSGRASPMELLCSDWTFKRVNSADDGLSTYNDNTRKKMLDGKTSMSFNTALSQIDTVNQAGLLAKNFRLLPKVQFESLFN